MITLTMVCSLTVLSGCQWFVRTETVSVPIPVACVDAERVPGEVPRAEDQLRKEDSPGKKITVVMKEREELRFADSQFRALITGCLK